MPLDECGPRIPPLSSRRHETAAWHSTFLKEMCARLHYQDGLVTPASRADAAPLSHEQGLPAAYHSSAALRVTEPPAREPACVRARTRETEGICALDGLGDASNLWRGVCEDCV